MKTIKFVFIGIIIFLSTISCSQYRNINPNSIEVIGTIQKQEMTSYQYGTHTISEYAIKSESIRLDDYIDRNVTIVGKKIDGYPIDGGPVFLEVIQIK